MKWYIRVLKKYLNFNGRARRKEYWTFVLFHFLIIIFLSLADIGLKEFDYEFHLTGIYFLSTILPYFSVTVRRLHDISKSAWMILLTFIPILVLLILEITLGESSTSSFPFNPVQQSDVHRSIITFASGVVHLIFGVWFFILLIKEGDIEPNKYGNAPAYFEHDDPETEKIPYPQTPTNTNKLITFFILLSFGNQIAVILLNELVQTEYRGEMKSRILFTLYLFFVNIAFTLFPLLMSFLLPKKTRMRTILTIIAVLIMLYSFYLNINSLPPIRYGF